MVPSEKYAARRGSVEDEMRMITARFAHALQRYTSRTYMHCLLIFQEVMPISKTRNQLHDKLLQVGGARSSSIYKQIPSDLVVK